MSQVYKNPSRPTRPPVSGCIYTNCTNPPVVNLTWLAKRRTDLEPEIQGGDFCAACAEKTWKQLQRFPNHVDTAQLRTITQ